MLIRDLVRQRVLAALKGVIGEEASGLAVELEHPEREEFGDYSTNWPMVNFHKVVKPGEKLTPKLLAEKIVAQLKGEGLIKRADVAGAGFVNIWLQNDLLISEIQRVIKERDRYGSQELGTGRKIVVDYSSPNIAKRFGIGHLRSTVIGQAIYNLYQFLGYTTIGDNHLGDWGTQFGKLLFMVERNKDRELSIDDLERWYVEFHQHPEWEDEGRKWFKRLENKDPIALEIWQRCVEVSLVEFRRIYDLLDVKIDYSYGESYYEEIIPVVIKEAREKNLTEISDGAEIMQLPEGGPPLMLLKSDGTTTYATRDLAAIRFRMQEWNPEIIVYEVGNEQALHFRQVFVAARLLGYVGENVKLVHTKHGLYLNPDGKKFSTRKGDTVRLEEVLEEAINRAKSLGEADWETARQVGVGAIKYFDLSHNVQSDIVFDWDKVMALEGNSGPYLQYTHARISSLLDKSGIKFEDLEELSRVDQRQLSREEWRLARHIYRFPEEVLRAAERFSPNLLCQYLYELAGRYNSFYNQQSVLAADNFELKRFRLGLSAAVGQILKNGLRLLGIAALERM